MNAMNESSMTLPGVDFTGLVLGRYVREARDHLTGKMLVIKGPFTESCDPDQFSREADILSQLSFDGVVGLRQCFRSRRRCWLVMDRLPGRTLQAKGMSGTGFDCQIGRDRIGWFITRVARIVERCHRHGWAHGDICPDNIQVSGQRIWLLDFGASLALGQRYPRRRQVRARWSSPSLLMGKGRVSAADDVYSLLLLSCLLLTGQPPLPCAPSQRADFSHWARNLDRPERLSRRQWMFMRHALEKPHEIDIQDLAVQALSW